MTIFDRFGLALWKMLDPLSPPLLEGTGTKVLGYLWSTALVFNRSSEASRQCQSTSCKALQKQARMFAVYGSSWKRSTVGVNLLHLYNHLNFEGADPCCEVCRLR